MKQRTQKMWSLVNKTTGGIIKIGVSTSSIDDVFAIGFETRGQLMTTLNIQSMKELEFDEVIKELEIKL